MRCPCPHIRATDVSPNTRAHRGGYGGARLVPIVPREVMRVLAVGLDARLAAYDGWNDELA
jgi:hypothetical protein